MGSSSRYESWPDVLYLDIQLGARSGFDVVDGLRGAEGAADRVHDGLLECPCAHWKCKARD